VARKQPQRPQQPAPHTSAGQVRAVVRGDGVLPANAAPGPPPAGTPTNFHIPPGATHGYIPKPRRGR
jgi:hypothetical protein